MASKRVVVSPATAEETRAPAGVELVGRANVGRWDYWFELGGSGIDCQLHTHRHRFPEDEAEAAREIAENRAALENVVSGPLEHFCYPGGVWSEEQWPVLESAGVRSAVTCQIGLNDDDTPPYALRRLLDAEDVSQIEFEAEMAGCLELLRKVRSCLTRVGGILKWRRKG